MPFLRYLDSGTLFALLLGLFVLSIEVGHWLGKRRRGAYDSATIDQLGALQTGLLGILGLIIGFSFALALGRFDDRRVLVIKQAAAISDAFTRTGTLPAPENGQARRVLERYVDVSLKAFEQRRNTGEFERATREIEALNRELWSVTERASQKDPRPVLNLFVMAVNDIIDLHIHGVSALASHVPPMVTVVVVMFAMLGMAAMVFSSTVRCGQRLGMWLLLACLLSSLLLMILDLDRPRMGLIPVNHEAMYYQQKVMRSPL